MPAVKNATSLNQTEVWVDQRGVEHQLDDMSVRYKTNVVGFIERNAARIVANALVNTLVHHLSQNATIPCVYCEQCGITKPHEWEHGVWHGVGPVPGSEIEQMLQNEMSEPANLPTISVEEAVEIVRRTPLVVRLLDDIANDRGGVDGDAPARPNGRPHLSECPTLTDSRAQCMCDDDSPEWTI